MNRGLLEAADVVVVVLVVVVVVVVTGLVVWVTVGEVKIMSLKQSDSISVRCEYLQMK